MVEIFDVTKGKVISALSYSSVPAQSGGVNREPLAFFAGEAWHLI
jgi:hypothetical protein